MHGFLRRTLQRRQTFSILFQDCRQDYWTSKGDFFHRLDKRQQQMTSDTQDIFGLDGIQAQLDAKDISQFSQFLAKITPRD